MAKPPITEKSAPNSSSVVLSGLMSGLPNVEEGTKPLIPPMFDEDSLVYFAFVCGMLPVCPYAPRNLRLSKTDISPNW